ncbi:MAG: NADH-quinone oxidoreductase subunit NuoF [Candidatus Lernaella stagnicola]|nr:NADH-quinone oxidoreductase subunit NuoF [Candidatus Lernaella stagnicola]
MARLKNYEDLEQLREQVVATRESEELMVAVCAGTGCKGSGADAVVAAFKAELEKQGLANKVTFRATGCHGFCERGTLVVIYPQKLFYQLVGPDDVAEIVEKTVKNGEIIERLLFQESKDVDPVQHEADVPFYKYQKRLIFGNNGRIDPKSIEDYIAWGGYVALAKALRDMNPDSVLEEVKTANLRGRGGGGFPAGIKWETTKKAPGEPKYVLCNADEGDPGAYMDRSLLEGNPHSVLEGMLIGAFAIGAGQGFIYVRNEYPLAVENTMVALEQAREFGLLGDDILGSGFSFDVKVNRGGGAFVCGESTALFASVEGRPGEPRGKFVRSAERGLYDKPSNLNNVETWANVPIIIRDGAAKFREIGTEGSPGTKIFSLVGKINNTGLVEVPMGITLREIIYDIGGGIPNGKKFKAVQTGGPSGGCIPEEHLDLQIDFDKLNEVGSMMGSGGLIVMDEDTCMVDIARYFIEFLCEESCGKCLPCREGLAQLCKLLQGCCQGTAEPGDLELIADLCDTIAETSLCALGQTAPNPVLSTIKFFRDEYEAHIHDKRCPAGVCPDLLTFSVIDEKCIGCGACKRVCPVDAIEGEKKEIHKILDDKCIRCGQCFDACPVDAILKE